MSETTLVQALAAAQTEMKNAGFDKVNPHFNSKFASLTSVRNTVLPILAKHGIALTQGEVMIEGRLVLRTTLYKGDQTISEDVTMIVGKKDMHGQGSALTYARRYGMCGICGVAADEDDDGNQAVDGAAEPVTITAEQATKIASEMERVGGDSEKLLAHFQIESFAEMDEAQFNRAVKMIEDKEAKQRDAA